MPILLLVISSFTDNDTLLRNGYSFFPGKLSNSAYTYLFDQGAVIFRAYGISFFVTIVGTTLSVIITTLISYPLARNDLPGKNVLSFFVFFTLLFNGGLVPTYLMYTGIFGIKNSIWALIVPSLLMNAFNVLLVRSYFVTGVPTEILEAARIDGASEFTTFRRVAAPMAKPIIATVALFVGIMYWNDWNNGYIYLTTRTDLFSIQNLLNRMIQNIQFLSSNPSSVKNVQEGLAQIPSATVRMAIAVTGILPIVVVYPFIQGNFVKGITLGGVKG
ncbi:carbohydrate ABC transporter permease [Paenibacillus albidus]|uniref:carbohydrate ABC transporter permease n=1 Tax=Paenibacillus albidus TaxID=2041023 RepID=UPI00288A6A93|nr:carbohydrate ABC transporter permease [Paenibacillus albidus]